VQNAITVLQHQPERAPERMELVGRGLGGGIVVQATAVDSLITPSRQIPAGGSTSDCRRDQPLLLEESSGYSGGILLVQVDLFIKATWT
jgi:hypothetical protein